MSIFSDRLIALAEENNLSQAALAELLGISQNTIVNWKNDSEPKLMYLQKAASVFCTTTDYLLGLCNNRDGNESEKPLTPKEIELMNRIKGRFSNSQLEIIMKVIDGLEKYDEAGSQVQPENKIEEPSGEEIVSH